MSNVADVTAKISGGRFDREAAFDRLRHTRRTDLLPEFGIDRQPGESGMVDPNLCVDLETHQHGQPARPQSGRRALHR